MRGVESRAPVAGRANCGKGRSRGSRCRNPGSNCTPRLFNAIETNLVLRRREDRFHHLLVAVFGPKRAPRRVADHRVVAQFVRHAQQAALEIGPARSFRPLGDAMNLLVGRLPALDVAMRASAHSYSDWHNHPMRSISISR